MTRSLSNPVMSLTMSATVRNSLDDLGRIASVPAGIAYTPTLANGTDADQADRCVEFSATLAASGTQVIDLSSWVGVDLGAGDGNDGTGQALYPLYQIMAIAIVNENDVDAAGFLEIEPDVTEGWTPIGSHTVALGGALPGQGVLIKVNPAATAFEIVEGVSSRILLTAVDDDVTYRVFVFARSVAPPSSSSSSGV